MKILVIGGGASGMMAALTASQRPENEVLLLERQARVGRKLLATGNGRCNLTNRNLSPQKYHGEDAAFCSYALELLNVEKTLALFRSMGLLTVAQADGRIYPHSDSANSVVDVLRLHLQERSNVTLRTACEVRRLEKTEAGFAADTEEETFRADRVILCTGGLAGGKLGGVDAGYRLLGAFGHKRTKLLPALVQLRTDTTYVRALKGVRCDAEVTLVTGAHVLAHSAGEIQFTEYGVSGPAIFEISREAAQSGGTLRLDLLQAVSEPQLLDLLRARCEALPALKAEELLTGIVHNRLGRTLVRSCGIASEAPLCELGEAQRSCVCRAVKAFELPVTGTQGMDDAQVTAGGIRTEEFNPRTLESRLCPGLYAAGEVLDVDGDCGGYNLQWAWSSGYLAGLCGGNV